MPKDQEPVVDKAVKRQLDWLDGIAGKVADSATLEADLKEREIGMAIIGSLDDKKEVIRNVMLSAEFKVSREGGIGTKTLKLLDEDGDYRNEIDTRHHGPDLIEKNAVDPAPLQRAYDQIMAVEMALKDNEYYNPPKPEFTEIPEYDLSALEGPALTKALDDMETKRLAREKEMSEYALAQAVAQDRIAEDLWHPLVREGIIPENLVPQKYSSVAQLFAAASEEYDARLLEHSKELTDKDILKEKFDLGFKIATATLKLAGAANTLGSEIGTVTGNTEVVANTEAAAEFFGHFETALTIGEGLSTAALTDKDFTSVGQTIANTVFDSIAGELNPEVAHVVGACLSNGARMVSVSKMVAAKQYDEAFAELVGGMADELSKNDPDGSTGLMSAIAKQLTLSLSSVDAAKKIRAAIEASSPPDPKAVMTALMESAIAVGKDAGADVPTLTLDSFEDALSGLEEGSEALEKARADLLKQYQPGNMEDLQDEIEKREKEASIRAAELAKASAEEKAKVEQEQFEILMRTGLAAPEDTEGQLDLEKYLRSENIDTILAIQAKNDATFKMCKTIAEKGVGFVVKLFPPAAVAEAAMTLAFTIKDAVEKAEQLMIWRDNVEDALVAHSAVADAMLNRKGLQTKQTTQAGIQVALDAAKVVAEVLVLTPAAPAGPVVKASVATIEATIELTDLIYTEKQLADAWKIYERAKDDPEDRYLARKATRENPTLSKYAMAYASLKGDPIAVEGMRRCGLSKITLANPDTNINKVVTYLETKYPDDPVLLRAVPVPDKWYPGSIELTVRCWMTFYHAAISEEVKLSSEADTSGIAGAMAKVEEESKTFDAALDRCVDEARSKTLAESANSPVELLQTEFQPLVAACLRLQDQLAKYTPRDTENNAVHKSMAKVVDALAAKSEQKVSSVNRVLKDKPWKSFYKSAEASPTELAEKMIKDGKLSDPSDPNSDIEGT